MHSLRRQLLLWLLVPLGALLGFNAWTTWRSAQSAASSVQDRMLRAQNLATAEMYPGTSPVSPHLRAARSRAARRPDSTNRVLSGCSSSPDLPSPTPPNI